MNVCAAYKVSACTLFDSWFDELWAASWNLKRPICVLQENIAMTQFIPYVRQWNFIEITLHLILVHRLPRTRENFISVREQRYCYATKSCFIKQISRVITTIPSWSWNDLVGFRNRVNVLPLHPLISDQVTFVQHIFIKTICNKFSLVSGSKYLHGNITIVSVAVIHRLRMCITQERERGRRGKEKGRRKCISQFRSS